MQPENPSMIDHLKRRLRERSQELKAVLKKNLTRENTIKYVKTRSPGYWLSYGIWAIIMAIIWESAQGTIATANFLAQTNYTIPLAPHAVALAEHGFLVIGFVLFSLIPMAIVLFLYICFNSLVAAPHNDTILCQQIIELTKRIEELENKTGVTRPIQPKINRYVWKGWNVISLNALFIMVILIVTALYYAGAF